MRPWRDATKPNRARRCCLVDYLLTAEALRRALSSTSPSAEPSNASEARSGCGIKPTTLPAVLPYCQPFRPMSCPSSTTRSRLRPAHSQRRPGARPHAAGDHARTRLYRSLRWPRTAVHHGASPRPPPRRSASRPSAPPPSRPAPDAAAPARRRAHVARPVLVRTAEVALERERVLG